MLVRGGDCRYCVVSFDSEEPLHRFFFPSAFHLTDSVNLHSTTLSDMPFSSIAESDSDDVPTSTIKIQTRDTFDYTEKNVVKCGENRIINKTIPPGKFTLRLSSNKKVICSITVSYMGRPFYELRAQVGGSKKNQKFEATLMVEKDKNPAIFQAKLENKSRLFGSPAQYKFEIKKESQPLVSPHSSEEKIQLKILLSDSELGRLSIRKIAVPNSVSFDDLLFTLRREFNFPHLMLQYEDTEDGSMIDICSQEGWEALLTQYRAGLISFITLVITPVIDIVTQGDTELPPTNSRNSVNNPMSRKIGQALTALRTKTTPYGNPIKLTPSTDDNRDTDVIDYSGESSRDSISSPLRIANNTDLPFEPHSAPAGFSLHQNSNGPNFSVPSSQTTNSSNRSPPSHRHSNSIIGLLQRRSHDDDDLFGSPTRITSAVLELRNLKELSQNNEVQTLPRHSGSVSASASPRMPLSTSPTKTSAMLADPRQLDKLKRRLSQEFSRRYQANFYDDPRTVASMSSQPLSQFDRDDPFGERRNKTMISGGGGGGSNLNSMSSGSSASGAGSGSGTGATTSMTSLSNTNPRLDSKKFAIPSQSNKQHSNKHVHGQIRWKRANLIGSGAFGNVYLGMDTKTGKFLAVKQIEVGKKLTPEQKRKLEEEIALMKNLSHPHIVRYYGMEITESHINIFLEYVPGGSIESLLRKFGKFGEAVASCYTQQILLGLQYLHERGVLHRDIKGANLLVDENGNVKLADFGSSKSIDELNATVEGRSLTGTPNFMAPEVIINAKYTNGSDIWAVGCTLLEMLTGQPPWAQMKFDNPISAMFHIAQSKVGPKVPDDLSEQAKSFINACFAMDSDVRPTAAELLCHPFITNVQDLSDEESDEDAEYQVSTPVDKPNADDLLPVAEASNDANLPPAPVAARSDDGDFNKTDQAIIEYEDWSSSELVTDYSQRSTDSASETEDQEGSTAATTEPAALSEPDQQPLREKLTRDKSEAIPALQPSLTAPSRLPSDQPSNSAEMISELVAAKSRSHLSKSSRRNQSARFGSSRSKILTPYILSFLRRNAAEQRNMISMNEGPPTPDIKSTSPRSDSPPVSSSSTSSSTPVVEVKT